jgi:hypothetical protein
MRKKFFIDLFIAFFIVFGYLVLVALIPIDYIKIIAFTTITTISVILLIIVYETNKHDD